MRISARVESSDPGHTTIRVYVNGASAGLLTMRTADEVDPFLERLGADVAPEERVRIARAIGGRT